MTRFLQSLLLLALALAPSFAHAIDLKKTRVTHLDNGLTLLILEEHALPVVSVQMAYKTGGRDDPEGRMGLAHFFEHMAFRSSKNFPGTRLAGDIYAVGGEWHGYTWIDTVTFFATAPKDDLDLLLRIEADRLGRLKMDPSDVEAETGAVIAEMNGYANDPATILFDATLAAAFQVHPYRKNTIGYEADVKAITHADIVEFYENNIGPKTAVLAVAGDVDADMVEARVRKLFGRLKTNAGPQLPPMSEPTIQGEKRVRLEGGVDQKLFRIAYPAPAASSDDYPAFLVLQALAGASSGASFLQNDWGTSASEGSALYGVTDDVRTWFIPTAQPYVFLIAGSASTETDEVRIENAVQHALDGLAAEPVSDSKLNAARSQVQRQVVFDLETTEDAAHQLAFFETIGALDQLLTLEASISSVTQADIQRVAKTYLNADRRTVGWFVPDTDGAPGAIVSPDTLAMATERRGEPAAATPTDKRYSKTHDATIVVPSPLSPSISLRALLPGVYDCEGCAPNDPAPGITTLAKNGLLQEFDVMLHDVQAAIANASPHLKPADDINDPYTRVEQIFTARFATAETPEKAAPAFIAVSGPADPENFKKAIEHVLGGGAGERPSVSLVPSTGDIHVHIAEEKAQLALGYMAAASGLETDEAIVWRLALYIFAHGYGGRLGEEAISDQGLAYYIGAEYRGGKDAGLITLNIGVDPDKQQALLEVLKAELARMVSEPPSEAELAEAKRHLIGRKISAAQSNDEITAALARDWAGPGLTTIEEYAAAVNAVTLDQLRDVLPAFADGDFIAISAGGEKQDRLPPETSPKREQPMSQTAKHHAKPVLVADQDSQSLPAWTYYDQDFFELEREKIFLPAWHLVGHENDLQEVGDYLTFKMYNEIAFVVRGKDRELRGFHNVCRHRAARMVDGDYGNCGRSLVCPYHAWTYQLDGTLTGVPYLDQYENFDKAEHRLTPVEVDSFAGFVFLRFVSGGPSLKDYMAPVAEEFEIYKTKEMKPLRHVGGRLREVNWKNATDNYVDALHIPIAHDGLHGLLGSSYKLTIDRDVHKIFSQVETKQMSMWSNRAYRQILPHVDHLPEDRQHMWTYYKLWPNLMFDFYADQIDFMQFIPLTPTTCILRESAYALDDDRREMKLARYLNCRINRNVNREDKGLIERVQDGMGSMTFAQGPLGTSEVCLRHFAKQMREAIPVAKSREKPSPDKIQEAFRD